VDSAFASSKDERRPDPTQSGVGPVQRSALCAHHFAQAPETFRSLRGGERAGEPAGPHGAKAGFTQTVLTPALRRSLSGAGGPLAPSAFRAVRGGSRSRKGHRQSRAPLGRWRIPNKARGPKPTVSPPWISLRTAHKKRAHRALLNGFLRPVRFAENFSQQSILGAKGGVKSSVSRQFCVQYSL
jgi:hypothetical protein